MLHRALVSLGVAVSMVVLAVPAGAQTGPAGNTYSVPRTEWGQPNLQGVWGNNAATPMERPKELEGRTTLTPEEVDALKRRAADLFNGETDAAFGDSVFETVIKDAKTFKSRDTQTGNYNHFWVVDRDFDSRTSLVTDPPDGRVPALTPEAVKRQADAAAYRRDHPADGPEDLPLSHRCITFGHPNTFAGYNSYYQIIQSHDYVAIVSEMIHDARVIPLDNRPALNPGVQQWLGSPRGRFEGDTLVIETANFTNKRDFRGARENLRLVERITRVSPETLKYEYQVTDPATFTKPWSFTVYLSRTSEHIYEFACHEGNLGLWGALTGYRAKEKEEVAAAVKGSN